MDKRWHSFNAVGRWWWCQPRTGGRLPGVVRYEGKYYVWPAGVVLGGPDDHARAPKISPCPPFDTKEAAMAACRLIYG